MWKAQQGGWTERYFRYFKSRLSHSVGMSNFACKVLDVTKPNQQYNVIGRPVHGYYRINKRIIQYQPVLY
jgi:hypothetical protein